MSRGQCPEGPWKRLVGRGQPKAWWMPGLTWVKPLWDHLSPRHSTMMEKALGPQVIVGFPQEQSRYGHVNSSVT